MSNPISATCRCGKVKIEATGNPILVAQCHCTDCRKAGQYLESLADAPAIISQNGGTDLLLVRKDRFNITQGDEHLVQFLLTPQSPTRRVVAKCCNSAMFLDFTKGHWLSVYSARMPEPRPTVQMRVMTGEAKADADLPTDMPNYQSHSKRFIAKLVLAWLKMGFRTPKLPQYRPLS